MNSQPLMYASLKCVLQNMDPNMRFQLAICCPSIRKTEKAVPLKINNLAFSHRKFSVDGTEYSFGVLHVSNNFEAFPFEIDQYGRQDHSFESIVTTGDVVIHANKEEDEEEDEEDEEEEEEDVDEEEEQDSMTPKEDTFCKPLQKLLEMTIKPEYGKPTTCSFTYTKKLHDARKTLSSFLFGKRPIIQVNWLEMDRDMIVRLPLSLKLKIRNLKVFGNIETIYEALKPIVDDSSYPLECLESDNNQENFQNFDHPIVKSAESLTISSAPRDTDWLLVLLSLPNHQVHVDHEVLLLGEYFQLIRHWLRTGREIGSVFSFSIRKEKTVTLLMDLIKEQFKETATRTGQRCVTLPMNKSSELSVFYDYDCFGVYVNPFDFQCYPDFIFCMEVTPIGK